MTKRLKEPSRADLVEGLLSYVGKVESVSGFFDKLSAPMDIPRLLDRLSREMRGIINWSRYAVFLVETTTNEFILEFSRPREIGPLWKEEFNRHVEGGSFAWALNQGRPSFFSPYAIHRNMDKRRAKSLVLIPLITLDKTIGMVFILSPLREENISSELIKLLTILSRLVAFALENYILLADLKRSHEEIEEYNRTLEAKVWERTRELEEANQELRRMDKIKDDFLSMVSHELRTPLTSIKAYTETLLLRVDKTDIDTQQEFLGIINDESDRLTRLINDFLDLRKMEAGVMNYQKMEFDLKGVLKIVTETFEGMAASRNITLSTKLSPAPHPIHADSDRIYQVFSNLVSNAIKYNQEGGKVWMTSRVYKDRVEVRIRDNGIGIAGENLERIFDKFQQVDGTSTRKVGGTGLGLAIVRNIIEAHDGKIQVKSEVDKGTTFIVSLPKGKAGTKVTKVIDKEEKEADESHPAKGKEIEDPTEDEGKSILVVDDEKNLVKKITLELEERGYQTLAAYNGKEALESIRKNRPDLVILDIWLPLMDGYEIMRILKEEEDLRGIPVLIITASDIKASREKCLKMGADGYLAKPFKINKLISRVDEIVLGS